MPIDLTQFERGAPFSGDYHATLRALQDRLARLQQAQIAHARRAIIVIEGWEASGRREALRTIAGAWDPCHFAVVCGAGDDDQRHWLAQYWTSLPQAGCSTFYFPSWYQRLLDERLAGRWDGKRWARACDEVNEFEAQQRDHGSLVVKLFFHLGGEVQADRLRQRADDPWRKASKRPGERIERDSRNARLAALGEIFAETDTRWAPWRVIAAGDGHAARIAALGAVAEALEQAVPAEPPADGDTVVSLQRKQYG